LNVLRIDYVLIRMRGIKN